MHTSPPINSLFFGYWIYDMCTEGRGMGVIPGVFGNLEIYGRFPGKLWVIGAVTGNRGAKDIIIGLRGKAFVHATCTHWIGIPTNEIQLWSNDDQWCVFPTPSCLDLLVSTVSTKVLQIRSPTIVQLYSIFSTSTIHKTTLLNSCSWQMRLMHIDLDNIIDGRCSSIVSPMKRILTPDLSFWNEKKTPRSTFMQNVLDAKIIHIIFFGSNSHTTDLSDTTTAVFA